jgi:phospholipase/lecithinase/hemolysin
MKNSFFPGQFPTLILTLRFTNATDACGAVPGANSNDYTFWDGIHPTTAAHMVIANAFVAQAFPEPSF